MNQDKCRTDMLFMVISDLYNHRWKQWRGQLTNTFLFYTMMLPVHLGGGREMMTLEGFLFFFCFFFLFFFVLWFISWESPRYFERNVLYLMLLGHLFAIIYSWKRKRRCNWWFERHILSLSHKPWKHMSHWCAAIFI